MYLSVVLPVRNEAKNLPELHERLLRVCNSLGKDFEIIYVENGSADNTIEILKSLRNAKVIILRWAPFMKSGQSAAMDAGIKNSQGDVIVTLDADLQNPPEEIPKLLKKMEDEDLDVVSGWRKNRKDKASIKYLSKFGSVLRKFFIDPGVHDLGCTLKAYKKECFEDFDLYGEAHRYIVAILKWRGFTIGEVIVEHAERKNGTSYYNWKKMFRGFVDMLMVWFWQKYSNRPLHLFGVGGIFISSISGIWLFIMLSLRALGLISLGQSIWPILAVLGIIVGVQFFLFGMVMDMVIRNYYANSNKRIYYVKEMLNFENN